MTSRIAVVGAGLIGRRHIDLIQRNPDTELASVTDPQNGPPDLGVPAYADLGEMLSHDRPDGVILATPNHLHAQQVAACIEAGLPTLVEKPVTDWHDDALRLAALAEDAGVPVLVGHHRRHSPLLQAASAAIAAGELGDIVAVSGTAMYHKPDEYFEAGPWRREAGGGPILVNLIHEVDDLRMLCGDIVEVGAVASSATRGFDVEDTVAMTFRFASGALGSFILSDTAASIRSWENLSGEDPGFPRYADADCYVVSGTRGSLEMPTMRLRTPRGAPSWWSPMDERVLPVTPRDPLDAQLEHFVDLIRGGRDPLVTIRDAAETLRVTLAIAAAAHPSLAPESGARR